MEGMWMSVKEVWRRVLCTQQEEMGSQVEEEIDARVTLWEGLVQPLAMHESQRHEQYMRRQEAEGEAEFIRTLRYGVDYNV